MNEFTGEIFGTFILILLGNGVVANTNLRNTHSNGGGWIVITTGWALAVFAGVVVSADISGAHLNPAVTLGLAISGKFAWSKVLPFILAQMVGAFLAAVTVYLFFYNHFKITDTPGIKKACFCTSPAIRDYKSNFLSEMIGTFILLIAILFIKMPEFQSTAAEPVKVGMGSLGAIPVALIVFSIGLSLGGTTGYAINPARDLGPRLAHFMLPIPGKDPNDWGYSWVPVLGPLAGAALAGLFYLVIK